MHEVTRFLKSFSLRLTLAEFMVKGRDLICYVCLTESRPSDLSHHYNTRTRERCGLQQAVHGLFSGDLNQKARRENQHLLSLCSFWLCGVGLHCRSHPYSWCPDIRLEPHPGGQGAERFPAEPFCFLHPPQCHLGRVRRLCSARYLLSCQHRWRMLRNVLPWVKQVRTC